MGNELLNSISSKAHTTVSLANKKLWGLSLQAVAIVETLFSSSCCIQTDATAPRSTDENSTFTHTSFHRVSCLL